MADQPIGGVAAPVTLPGAMLPMPAVARILARYDRDKLEAFIAIAIDLADTLDGDPEAEAATWPENSAARAEINTLPDDSEPAGDEVDAAYLEWDSIAHRARRTRSTCQLAGQEDDETTGAEDDWHPEGGNFAQSSAGQHVVGGAGCPISDPDTVVDDGPIDGEGDCEREQMTDDVPMLPVFSAAHNVFTDRRVSLGLSNLQSSYRTNGGEVQSADSGAVHRSTWHDDRKPGMPV